MTEQEIEKLREKLGDGFEITAGYNCAVVTVSDIWKDVEFEECVGNNGYSDSWTIGEIYPVEKVSNSKIVLYDNLREYCPVIDFDYRYHPELVCFKPSTESAYVEQLKSKAKELYGEIENGDRFDCYMLDPSFVDHELSIVTRENDGFEYIKKWDRLYKIGTTIYQQGKWAKKVEEPIRVNVSSVSYLREPIEYMGKLIPSDTIDCTVHFTIEGSSPKIIPKDDFRELLSKCLEDYLNKKP